MKLLILVETPNDDDLHWPRIERALFDYIIGVRCGNSNIGRTGGPNRMVTSGGIKVLEVRVDRQFILRKIGDHMPTFRRWWWRLSAWWLHSRLNPWSIVDLPPEETADGGLLFKSARRYRFQTINERRKP